MADPEAYPPYVPGAVTAEAPPEVNRLARVGRMRGDWRSARFALTKGGLSAHLALTPDALWAGYRGELRRYPLRALKDCAESGAELRLRFRHGASEVFQAFRFPRAAECQEWRDLLLHLKGGLPEDASALEECPEVVPVALLQDAPAATLEPAGEVESCDESRDRARFGLQLRAALAGADAVAGVREERRGTAFAVRGTAVRATDAQSRRVLRLRWCATRAEQLSLSMLVFVGVSFVLTLLVGFAMLGLSRTGRGFPPGAAGPTRGLLLDMALVIAAIHAWPLALAALLRWLRWPELLRPAGLGVLLLGAKPLADWLGAAAAGATPGSWTSEAFILRRAADLVNLGILGFSWFLCRAAFRAHRQFRALVPDAGELLPPARGGAEFGAMAATVLCGALACGFVGWGRYAVGSAFAVPGDRAWKEHQAVVTYQEGLSKFRDLEAAEADFRRSLALWEELSDAPPGKPEHRHNLAATCQNLGTALFWQGRLEEAIGSLRQALAHYDRLSAEHPSYREHRRGRAVAAEILSEAEGFAPSFEDRAEADRGRQLEQEGRHGEAVEHYRKAVARQEGRKKEFTDPNLYRRLLAYKQNRLAWALATSSDERVRDARQAVALAREAAENSPEEGSIWNTLGAAYYRAGDWKACEGAIERSLKLSGYSEGFDWLFLAMASQRQGKGDEARRWLARAEGWMARLDEGKFRSSREQMLWLTQRDECVKLRDEAARLIRGKQEAK